MRRLLTGLSLAATFVLGGMAGGCQPTKPCRCVQSEGCRCPLPPVARKVAPSAQRSSAQAQGPETPVRSNGQRAPGKNTISRQAASDETSATHRHGSDHLGEARLTFRPQPGPAGQVPSAGQTSHANVERHNGHTVPHEHPAGGENTPPSSRSGGALSSDDNPRNYWDRESARSRPAPMSINARDALDPWHGYDADCPERAKE